MIDPVIVSFELFGIQFAIHWYGVIIAISVMVGAFIAERQVLLRNGPENFVWDLLIWVVPAGIIGARLWYVVNDMAGGSQYFIEDPARILRVQEGGLHIYGAVLFGLLVAWWYARRRNFNFWMLLDAVAPTLLIAQAIGRIANFINQELYGPPTNLPWGVKIAAENRIPPWTDLSAFPVDSTRFHPTFFYESLWNLVMGGIIIWLVRKYGNKLKPGTAFYMWMIAAGVGRVWLEFFRPDQPLIPGTALSYSRVIAFLLAVVGIFMLLIRYDKIKIGSFSAGPDDYEKHDKKWKARKK